MMIFEKKQIAVLSLVLMIVVAGYLQYNYNETSMSAISKNTEAVYVSSTENDDIEKMNSQEKQEEKNISEVEETTKSSSNHASEYFSKVRLDKKITRGKNKEVLNEVLSNKNADNNTKEKISGQIEVIVSNSEAEMKIESLIKERGFKDVIAIIGDDGSIDLVIKAPQLSTAQVAQIADIASRQGDTPLTNIHIKNIF